jgi:hypothetical protein
VHDHAFALEPARGLDHLVERRAIAIEIRDRRDRIARIDRFAVAFRPHRDLECQLVGGTHRDPSTGGLLRAQRLLRLLLHIRLLCPGRRALAVGPRMWLVSRFRSSDEQDLCRSHSVN